MNQIANRQVICQVLLEQAKKDRDLVVLCSDSRGSASLTEFADCFPSQFVEMGIAEQSLVSTAAGLASCGKKAFAASPACFLSTRSMEQVKVDVAYSHTNVKLIGISGGVSYGALGMTHHSLQDIAAIGSIPGMRVYLPSDRHQTKKLIEQLLLDQEPAYIRVGRNPVEDIYSEEHCPFELNRAVEVHPGKELLFIACGEMVKPTLDAARLLKQEGVEARVLDLYSIKPLDEETVLAAASQAKAVVTVEEHSLIGGMGALISQLIGANCPKLVQNLGLPDSPVVTGNSKQVFDHYGLNSSGIASVGRELLKKAEGRG